jgi:hypothetical protein
MDIKEILSFVNIGDVKDINEFKDKFKTKFLSKDEIFDDEDVKKKLDDEKAKLTGKIAGSIATVGKRVFGLTNEEIKDKKWEEIIEMGANKSKSRIEELEGGMSSEDIKKEYESKIEKISKSANDYKTALETLQGTYEKEKGDFEGKLKGLKTGNLLEGAKTKLMPKLKEMTPAEKLGWDAKINSLLIDYDEKDNPVIKDKEGKRLQNPNKAGSFLTIDEALEQSAVELDLIKKNNGGGQKINQVFMGKENNSGNNGSGNDQNKNLQGRTIHPGALSHADKLRGE